MRFRFLLLPALLTALALALFACGEQPTAPAAPPTAKATAQPTVPTTPQPTRGGTLTFATSSDVDGLDPHRTVAAPTFDVAKSLYDTLIEADASGNLLPALATAWEASSDGLRWTFKLRDNVFFHNGRKFTAADVKFSFDRIRGKDSPRRGDFASLRDVETPNDLTATFVLSETSPVFISNLAVGWAAIVPQEAADTLKSKPVGTGPFQFVEWVPDSRVRVKRFEKYWKVDAPYLDEIVFKQITDPVAQLTALKLGEVDIAPVQPQNASDAQKTAGLKLYSAPVNPDATVALLAINNAKKPYDDLRVRQALNYAIDRQTLIEGAQFGYATPIGTHMAPTSPFYRDETQRYPYNPAKAKQLLADAGYPNGFETTIRFANFDIHRRNAEIIAGQLAAVGIKAKLESMELATWLTDVYRGRNYELNTLTHSARLDPDPLLNRYVCKHAENYRNYCNAKYDALIADAARTTDQARRKELYAEAQKMLVDEAVAVWLYSPHVIMGLRANVQKFNLLPIAGYDLREVSKVK
jgi:peptide/nickel transport system substrate-binding protein